MAPDLPAVCADEAKFKQIMYNLLSNAIKFTPDGGSVTVAAKLHRAHQQAVPPAGSHFSGECLKVSVADTGIGMHPRDHERIFVEFEQVDSSYGRRQQGHGTGIGA